MSVSWEQSSPGVGSFTEIRHFGEIASTNAYLLEEARAGAKHGLVAVADVQTAGRGRRDRKWEAPSGSSLLFSVLIRPRFDVPLFSYGAAMAISARRAIFDLADVEVDIKWPNDLLLGEKKLAGILVETLFDGPRLSAVVIGMGMNVNWTESFPYELGEIGVALSQVGVDLNPQDILPVVLDSLDYLISENHVGDVLRIYKESCSTIGTKVRVERDNGELEGVAKSINQDGALKVEDATGVTHLVDVGDVVHLRAD